MDRSLLSNIEKLLHDIGYFELEFQFFTKIRNGKTMYEYIGYMDAPMFIKIFISENEIEVLDCYTVENNYVQSKKLSIKEFLNYY